jgi:hypothetical protein
MKRNKIPLFFFFCNIRTYIFITANKMANSKTYNPNKVQKAIQRKAFMEAGGYDGRFRSKSVPSGKAYKRNQKHKGRAIDC